MSADPQPDPRFEDGLVNAFNLAADEVRTEPEPLVTGGLARGRTRRRRRRAAAIAGSVTALALIGTGGLLASSLSATVPTSDALSAAARTAPPHLDKSVNILLIGLDTRLDQDGNPLPRGVVSDQLRAGSSAIGGYNTDTLLVLHIPADGGRVQALSIPRDDWVQSYGADGRMHKIKEVYAVAKAQSLGKLSNQGLSRSEIERQGREAGRKATIETVQKLLDVPIDHFAELDMLGFYDVAKAVGPITVCLNQPVDDPITPRTTDEQGNVVAAGGGSGLRLPAGQSQLDAADALSFVRQRHHLPNGDLDRTHRQQAFIASVLYRLRQNGVLTDLARTQALYGAVKKDLVIDSGWNLVDFARQVPALTGGNVDFGTLPVDGFATRDGMDVNLVDAAKIQHTVRDLFGPGASASTAAGPAGSPPVVPPVSKEPQAAPAVPAGGIPCVN